MAIEILSPQTLEEWKDYFHLRWQILRAPSQQHVGSERDKYDDLESTVHLAAIEDGQIYSIGRLHFILPEKAQIRYMATHPDFREKGLGSLILEALEKRAKDVGVQTIILNAREAAVSFYERKEYVNKGKGHILYGEIQHFKMEKQL